MTVVRLMTGALLGDILNRAYQGGGDPTTLRIVAVETRAALPEYERTAFTEAVEMCGLWLPKWTPGS